MGRLTQSKRKETNRKRVTRWRKKNPEKAKAIARRWRERNPEKAKASVRRWREKNLDKVKASHRRWMKKNKEHVNAYNRRASAAYRIRHPERLLLASAKSRAKRLGLPFFITEDDVVIPTVCPVFRTPFVRGTSTAASLDRLIPSLGYISGNVVVISKRANTIKQDATAAELKTVAAWLEIALKKDENSSGLLDLDPLS